jgi:hypothetical protein
MVGTWRKHLVIRMTPTVAIGLLGILFAAPSASGQAAIDQYIPQGNPAAGSGGTGTAVGDPLDTLGPGGTGGGAIAVDGESGSKTGASVPLTNYPGTPFVWIVVAVLLAGALVRVAAPMIERRGMRGSG